MSLVFRRSFGQTDGREERVQRCGGQVQPAPPEARIPKRRWRFYDFKGDETLPTLYLHRQSAYLMGRERKVADIPLDHPSVRLQTARRPPVPPRGLRASRRLGWPHRPSLPYRLGGGQRDVYVNNQRVEAKRYVELFEKDVLKFGFSSREYVLLHEESRAEAAQDDMGVVDAPPPSP